VHHPVDLIDLLTIRCAPAAPLHTVDRAEFTIRASELIPDVHVLREQVVVVRPTIEEPEQLFRDDTVRHALGRDQREDVVLHAVDDAASRHAEGSRTCTVTFRFTFAHHLPQAGFVRTIPHDAPSSTGRIGLIHRYYPLYMVIDIFKKKGVV